MKPSHVITAWCPSALLSSVNVLLPLLFTTCTHTGYTWNSPPVSVLRPLELMNEWMQNTVTCVSTIRAPSGLMPLFKAWCFVWKTKGTELAIVFLFYFINVFVCISRLKVFQYLKETSFVIWSESNSLGQKTNGPLPVHQRSGVWSCIVMTTATTSLKTSCSMFSWETEINWPSSWENVLYTQLFLASVVRLELFIVSWVLYHVNNSHHTCVDLTHPQHNNMCFCWNCL